MVLPSAESALGVNRMGSPSKSPPISLTKSSRLAVPSCLVQGLALAIASLVFGATRGMIAAGPNHRRSRDLKAACFSALKRLLDSYPRAAARHDKKQVQGPE